MRAEFSRVIDPTFESVIGWVNAIRDQPASERPIHPRQVRSDVEQRLIELLSQRDHDDSHGEWILALFAMCAWADCVLRNADWRADPDDPGGNLGMFVMDNSLLFDVYYKRQKNPNVFDSNPELVPDAFEGFYREADKAAKLPRKDALEVFYLCTVLGFRADYQGQENQPQALLEAGGLEKWAQRRFEAIRTSSRLPELPAVDPEPYADPRPLFGRSALAWGGLLFVSLLVLLAVAGFFFYETKNQPGATTVPAKGAAR